MNEAANLGNENIKKEYDIRIQALEFEIKEQSANAAPDNEALVRLQQQLDSIANKYQADQSIGRDAYKLYFNQAILHHLKGDDQKALEFIESAENINGGAFVDGDELKGVIMTSDEPIKPIALGGEWIVASAGRRLANYLIDTITFYGCILVVFFGIGLIEGLTGWSSQLYDDEGVMKLPGFVLAYAVYIMYYFILEWRFGKTLGKAITRTKVVDLNQKPVGAKGAILRTLCRFIPFDSFSFLSNNPVGWHDNIPKTRVVYEQRNK